jgi:hypothetical protein
LESTATPTETPTDTATPVLVTATPTASPTETSTVIVADDAFPTSSSTYVTRTLCRV